MRRVHIEFKGVSPLIMHSCVTVNPMHPITRQLKTLTSKKKKTDEDIAAIYDLEWEGSMYWDDKIGPYIPAENIEATVRNGAKMRKKGKDVVRGFNVLDMCVPLNYGENLTKDQLRQDYRFRDVRTMTVQRNRVMRTRARFNMWRCEFDAMYDENILNIEELAEAIDYAGKYVGICDSRPKYGQFVASVTELD